MPSLVGIPYAYLSDSQEITSLYVSNVKLNWYSTKYSSLLNILGYVNDD